MRLRVILATAICFAIVMLAVPGLSAARQGGQEAGSVVIKKGQYGKRWPFTVKSGTLSCVSVSSVIFKANGRVYGVNGTALTHGYPRINPIWRLDPAYPKSYGLRVNIGPIIERGLKLC